MFNQEITVQPYYRGGPFELDKFMTLFTLSRLRNDQERCRLH